jgi:hypothetical protein
MILINEDEKDYNLNKSHHYFAFVSTINGKAKKLKHTFDEHKNYFYNKEMTSYKRMPSLQKSNYQILTIWSGGFRIGSPGFTSNAFQKGGKLLKGPLTRYFAGECGSTVKSIF